jgi:hypothetical protein
MITGAMAALMPDQGRRQLSDEERFEVELVLDAAADWQAGRLAWQDAARVGELLRGGRPSAAYTRFVAAQVAARSDWRRAALLALQEHLDRMQGLIVDARGTMTRAEWHEIAEAQRLMERMAA